MAAAFLLRVSSSILCKWEANYDAQCVLSLVNVSSRLLPRDTKQTTSCFHLVRVVLRNRWSCEGITTSHGLLLTFGRHRASFVWSSWVIKNPMTPNAMRRYREGHANRQDAHAMGLRRSPMATRTWIFGMTSGNFLVCQRFFRHTRCCCRSLRNSTDGHAIGADALTNVPMLARSVPKL